MSFKSRLSKAVHGEGNTARMPLNQEPLTAEEIQKIDEWIDFFCLISTEQNGAWTDTAPPTLYVSRSGPLKVGAYDYLSKLKSITVNGDAITLTDSVWTGPELKPGETHLIVATDNAGNATKVERFVRESETLPPVDDIEELKQRITELEAEVARQAAKLEEFWNWLGNQPIR